MPASERDPGPGRRRVGRWAGGGPELLTEAQARLVAQAMGIHTFKDREELNAMIAAWPWCTEGNGGA